MLEQFARFQEHHTTIPNLVMHFLTSVLQLVGCIWFVFSPKPLILVGVFAIPWVTDGIGHMLEGNFKEVWDKCEEGTNAAGLNPLTNWAFKLIALPIALISPK